MKMVIENITNIMKGKFSSTIKNKSETKLKNATLLG
jgi:hypothetical protein